METPVILLLVILIVALAVLFCFELTGITGAPYVPSEKKDIRMAFTDLYKLTGKDLVVDMGAGDGTVLEEATKLGARAMGLELNPLMALTIWLKVRKNDLAMVRCHNMYRFRLPEETTVVYAYAQALAIPRIYARVQKEATRLNKTLYLISNAFDVPDVMADKHLAPYYLYKIEPKK